MAGAALALVGCMDRDFNTPWLLNNLRVVAMRAEPPQPATGQSTTVSALVYQPPAGTDLSKHEVVTGYRWEWCPTAMSAQDPRECPVSQDLADQLFAGIPNVPRLKDLGTNATATFTNPFPASLLASLCQDGLKALPAFAGMADERVSNLGFACNIAGFPITIKLVVYSQVGDDPTPKEYPAIFKIYLPVNDDIAPNQNPVVGAISLREGGTSYPIDEAGTWSAVHGGEAPLLIDVPLSSSEPLPDWKSVYLKKDPHLKPNEQLTAFWFTEGGEFGADHKGGKMTAYYGGDPNDRVAPFSNLLENTLKPYKANKYDGDSARLYVVVTDIRGGVSWTTGVLRIVNTPESRDGGVADSPPEDGAPPDTAGLDNKEEAGAADAMMETSL